MKLTDNELRILLLLKANGKMKLTDFTKEERRLIKIMFYENKVDLTE